MTVNKAILVGNLGADPEVRSTGGGTPVCNLRLATSYRRKDADGEYYDETEWHNVVTFGKVAEVVNKYCRKGKQIYVEGRIQTRKWQDRDGNDRYTTEIVGDQVRFLSGGSDDDRGERQERRHVPDRDDETRPAKQRGQYDPMDDDDLPF